MTGKNRRTWPYKRNGAQKANFFSLPQYLISPTMLSCPLMRHFLPQSSYLSHNSLLHPKIFHSIPQPSIICHYLFLLCYNPQLFLTILHLSHNSPYLPQIALLSCNLPFLLLSCHSRDSSSARGKLLSRAVFLNQYL